MAIGQGAAFISVEADLRPFAKDLNREVPLILRQAEKAVKESATRSFTDAGKSGAKSFDRAFKRTSQGSRTFTDIAATLAEALDDGISALPAEVKAALILGIVAALPIVGALITGAISAALIVGFAGIGVLIAAQFEVVRQEGAAALTEIRNLLVSAGSVFVQPTLEALDSIRARLNTMEISFRKLFTTASKFIEPVVDALLSFVSAALPGLQESLDNLVPLLPTLVEGATLLGQAVGDALTVITDSGQAEASLEALFAAMALIVVAAGDLIRTLTEVYGLFLLINPIAGMLTELGGDTKALSDADQELTRSQNLVIAATKREEQALKDQAKAMRDAKKALDDYADAQFDYVQSQVDFERSLRGVTEAVKASGGSLKISSELGAQAVESITKALKDAKKEREDSVVSGRKTDAEAEAIYQKEIARVRDRAVKAGAAKKAYDELAASVLAVPNSPLEMKLSPTTRNNIRVIQNLIDRYLTTFGFKAPRIAVSGSGHNIPAYADGGIVTTPTIAVVGEAGPEAVVPLSNPKRAAAVMAEAGIGGIGDVYVYIGDEQLDGRMFRIARGAQRQQAQRLYAGTRSSF